MDKQFKINFRAVMLDETTRLVNSAKFVKHDYKVNSDRYTMLSRMLSKLNAEIGENGRGSLDMAFNIGRWDQSVTITLNGRGEHLKKMFYILRTLGYEPTSRPDETTKSSFYCRWKAPEEAPGIDLTLNFYSTVCKLKSVGTKMVEQTVYETVCDE